MDIEKGKTYKYLREKREVSQSAKDNMKYYTKIKKTIIDSLTENELNVDQLTQKLDLPKDEVVFYLMTLLKYGYIQPAGIDDMDEYFSYKIKNNGRD